MSVAIYLSWCAAGTTWLSLVASLNGEAKSEIRPWVCLAILLGPQDRCADGRKAGAFFAAERGIMSTQE